MSANVLDSQDCVMKMLAVRPELECFLFGGRKLVVSGHRYTLEAFKSSLVNTKEVFGVHAECVVPCGVPPQ